MTLKDKSMQSTSSMNRIAKHSEKSIVSQFVIVVNREKFWSLSHYYVNYNSQMTSLMNIRAKKGTQFVLFQMQDSLLAKLGPWWLQLTWKESATLFLSLIHRPSSITRYQNCVSPFTVTYCITHIYLCAFIQSHAMHRNTHTHAHTHIYTYTPAFY